MQEGVADDYVQTSLLGLWPRSPGLPELLPAAAPTTMTTERTAQATALDAPPYQCSVCGQRRKSRPRKGSPGLCHTCAGLLQRGIRHAHILSLRKEHPDWSLQQIGDEAGVSCERVRQILHYQGLPTNTRQFRTGFPKLGFCRVCGNKTRGRQGRVCNVHRRDGPRELFPCMTCGKSNERLVSEIKRNKVGVFCNHVCLGKWISAHYGFGAHRKSGRWSPKAREGDSVVLHAYAQAKRRHVGHEARVTGRRQYKRGSVYLVLCQCGQELVRPAASFTLNGPSTETYNDLTNTTG